MIRNLLSRSPSTSRTGLLEPICCADPGYPGDAGAECTCENYACTTSYPGECWCSLDRTGQVLGPRCLGEYDAGPCCLFTSPDSICECGDLASCEGGMEVPNCAVDILPCPAGDKVLVPSCR